MWRRMGFLFWKQMDMVRRTTPEVMKSIGDPLSFNGGALHQQLWICLFQYRICFFKRTSKKSRYRCGGSFLYQHQKSLELQLSLILRHGVHVLMFTCSSHRIILSRDFQRASKKCLTSNAMPPHVTALTNFIFLFSQEPPIPKYAIVSSCKTE